MNEAKAGVQLANVNLGRGQKLSQSQLISASALDELRAAQVQAQARAATRKRFATACNCVAISQCCGHLDDGIISSAWCSRAKWLRLALNCCV